MNRILHSSAKDLHVISAGWFQLYFESIKVAGDAQKMKSISSIKWFCAIFLSLTLCCSLLSTSVLWYHQTQQFSLPFSVPGPPFPCQGSRTSPLLQTLSLELRVMGVISVDVTKESRAEIQAQTNKKNNC